MEFRLKYRNFTWTRAVETSILGGREGLKIGVDMLSRVRFDPVY